jgi:hypothetical protein
MKRRLLQQFEHDGVRLMVWIERDELCWAYQCPEIDPGEWRDFGGAFYPTQTNQELADLWKDS